MAEVVGLIGAVITITATVLAGVKTIRTIHRTLEELKELQEQVEGFAILIHDLHQNHNSPPSNSICLFLLKAKVILEQLDVTIQSELIKKADGTPRARRRVWVSNKAKIQRSLEALKEQRQHLAALMTSKNSVILGRNEAALANISKRIGSSDGEMLSLDTQIFEMQHTLLRTHDAVMSQQKSLDRIAESVSQDREYQIRNVLTSNDDMSDFGSYENRPRLSLKAGNQNRDDIQTRKQTAPAYSVGSNSLIDSSDNFFPETYTVEERLPKSCLVAIDSYELECNGLTRKNFYRFFYRRSPRRWFRINVSLTIPRTSTYWTAASTSSEDWLDEKTFFVNVNTVVPHSLLAKMQTHLEEFMQSEEQQHIDFALSQGEVLTGKTVQSSNKEVAKSRARRTSSLHILAFLDDLGCPHYQEEEVLQIELLHPPFRFLSCISGRLVYETMLGHVSRTSSCIYNITVLHVLKDHPAFANLVGIKTNKSRTSLKSYLVDFPIARFKVINKLGDPNISWKRREKWARQIVEGVAQMHCRGLTLGTLLLDYGPVIIEESDSIQFWHFRQNYDVDFAGDSSHPPEFFYLCYQGAMLDADTRPSVTTKTDLYHLGLLLWLLAENKPLTSGNATCIRRQCPVGQSCTHSFNDGIILPSLPAHIPLYYRTMVNACRAENPQERPSARSLLKCFPRFDEPLFPATKMLPPTIPDLDGFWSGLGVSFTCDICDKEVLGGFYYHCNVCNTGDFDICHICYAAGRHCKEAHHLLVRTGKVGYLNEPRTYHSKVHDSGARDIIEL